jgi:nucleotide-binding universal stress UspA family protein
MRKLLVPVDGSETSLRALRYAISLAQTNGPLTVHCVSVHEEPIIFGEVSVYVSREKIAELQRKQCEGPLQVADELLKKAGVPHATEILEGPIAATIAKHADEIGCDGIVMGTRGMTALGDLLMGSVATKVLHAANVPVTLVK